jgi:hypothetical protein
MIPTDIYALIVSYMEGLVSYGINPFRLIATTNHQSRFLSHSQPNLKKGVCGFQIGLFNNKKHFSPLIMAASVENSQLSHFENTLPSKGLHKSSNVSFFM